MLLSLINWAWNTDRDYNQSEAHRKIYDQIKTYVNHNECDNTVVLTWVHFARCRNQGRYHDPSKSHTIVEDVQITESAWICTDGKLSPTLFYIPRLHRDISRRLSIQSRELYWIQTHRLRWLVYVRSLRLQTYRHQEYLLSLIEAWHVLVVIAYSKSLLPIWPVLSRVCFSSSYCYLRPTGNISAWYHCPLVLCGIGIP